VTLSGKSNSEEETMCEPSPVDYELKTLAACVEHLSVIDDLLDDWLVTVTDRDARRAFAYLGQRFSNLIEHLEEGRRVRSFQCPEPVTAEVE
jgi:hypothetical protein